MFFQKNKLTFVSICRNQIVAIVSFFYFLFSFEV